MFLTDAELIALTGYQRPAFVIRWLSQYGYRFEIAANGWPRVLRAVVEARLGNLQRHEPRLNLV